MVKIINAVDNSKKIISIEFEDITIEELMNELEINKIFIGAVLVDGVPKRLSDKFQDNSEIYILPLLQGG